MTTTNTTKTPAGDLTAWDMACAILTALEKAILKCEAEREEAAIAQGQDVRSGQARSLQALKSDLLSIHSDLDCHLAQHSRSNRWPMPKRLPEFTEITRPYGRN